MTTYEDAKKCPICGNPGEVKRIENKVLQGRKVELHHIQCVTKLCRWFETLYYVQVNEDGSIPEPMSQLGDKLYPRVSPEMETRIQENIQRQLEAETRPGGSEVRNPHG